MQIPIQLAEMSPPAFRATFPGVVYQIGNVSQLFFASWEWETDPYVDGFIRFRANRS